MHRTETSGATSSSISVHGRRTYGDEVDAFALYCPDTEVLLRLNGTRNNQALRVNWARDYEFGAKLGRPGAVAQLGEHLHGMQKARGSSPLRSTLF